VSSAKKLVRAKNMEAVKQVIVIRRDLNMRRGKEIAQGSQYLEAVAMTIHVAKRVQTLQYLEVMPR